MRTPQPLVFGLGFALCLLLALAALGRYARPDLEKVPVERLVTNLEEAVKKDPKSVSSLLNLARVHGMAYASKTDSAEVRKGKEEDGPWFGYEPKIVPFAKVEKTEDAEKEKAAKAHLAKAVEHYKQAVKLAPDNLPARLGYAWTLEQSGDKAEAVKEYRALIEEGWKKEKDLKALPLGGQSVMIEAAGYLIPLLDKEKDKDEIATLTERAAGLAKLPRPMAPIVVPLRDGLGASELEDGAATAAFDADGSGLQRRWTWITKDAGWLVYDPKGGVG